MTSPTAVTPVWQNPFVEVIKFGMTHRNIGWHVQGDVEETQDQLIHKNVFRIRGPIAATNYLRVPRDAAKGTHGLGLTGRYAYIQMRRIRDQQVTIHLDFLTAKKMSLRFTLSSIYHAFRSTGTVLRVPLSLDQRWTMVVVDMARLLELHSFNQHGRDSYRHLKAITLCASMNVRNFFISSKLYSPTTLPGALRFPGDFGDHFCWYPLPPNTVVEDNNNRRINLAKEETIRVASSPQTSLCSRVRCNSITMIHDAQDEDNFEAEASVREIETVAKMSPGTRDSNLRHDRNAILSKADQILRNAGVFDIGADAYSSQEPAFLLPSEPAAERPAKSPKRGKRPRTVSSSTKTEWPDPILELDRIIGFSNDFPHMLLWLPGSSACVYTSSSTIIIREFNDESNAANGVRRVSGETVESNGSTVAVKGTAETTGSAALSREYFLHGHATAVNVIAVTSDGNILASSEMPADTRHSGIRLWNLTSRECLTVIKAQVKGVHALCFSTPTSHHRLLCAVGRDDSSRTQICIWDCSNLLTGGRKSLPGASGSASLMARQTSDFPIGRIAFSPYEHGGQYHLVSCGRENVRYWRINPSSGHLTGYSATLNEYSRGAIFTDVGFDTIAETQPSNIQRVRPVYVSSSLGTLLVLDYDSREVLCVYQLHDVSINCLSINEGFCVTGSDDCFLRVWPLDFSDFFLEAHHEAGVSSLDVSKDGMKVIVGSRNNAIGVLDIADQHYATVLRSHSQKVTAMTAAPWGCPLSSLLIEETCVSGIGEAQSELVTASSDGTLRVWDASSAQQLFEFDIQQEKVTSLAASPTNIGIVAAGFASGCTRIFDVHRALSTVNGDSSNTSSMLREFWQHQSSIRRIAFDSDAQHLYTSGAGKQLCLYDARDQDYVPLKMLLADFDPDDGRFVLSHDKKWLAIINSSRQGILMLDPCSLRAVATVQLPKPLISSLNGQEETLKLVQFSNNETELLVLSASDRLHIFSLPTRAFVQSMPLLGQGGINALAMSANSKYMATGGVDGSLRVWHWDDRGHIGRMHQSFLGHAGKVNELVFTKDDKHILSTGDSSATCIWEFHGDLRPASPQRRHSLSKGTNTATKDVAYADDENWPLYPDEADANTSSLTSKSSFKLCLEADALMLGMGNDHAVREADSALNRNLTRQAPIVSISESTGVTGHLTLASAIANFNPSTFAWSYSTGKILFARNTTLVVEDVTSGRQTFYDERSSSEQEVENSNSLMQCSNAEIILVQLSPTGKYVATVSSQMNCISIRALDPNHLSPKALNGTCVPTNHNDPVLIALPLGTIAVTALEFGKRSRQKLVDGLVCVACEIDDPKAPQHVVVLASIASRTIIWSSMLATEWRPTATRQIVAMSEAQFFLLSDESNSVSVLTAHQNTDSVGPNVIKPTAELHSLIDTFPSQVQLIRTYSKRFLVGIDNERYCYFYDLQSNKFSATTHLLLLPKLKVCGNPVDEKVKSTERVVDFFEWVTAVGKSLLVTGSKVENVLYVHALPTISTKHSSRVQVDWKRVARAGVSLLCSIPLSGGGFLRSLSVDPARDVGIVTTDDGMVMLARFDSPPTVKVLRETSLITPSDGNKHNVTVSWVSWALGGAVLLTTSERDSAIRVWLPELSKELTCFQVVSASCKCFAVNPYRTSSESAPQSMIMAGYSDGSLRVFDLCEMRLLIRFDLNPSSAKSGVDLTIYFDRVVFVGAFTAFVVTKDHRVFLVDISKALECVRGVQDSKMSSRAVPTKKHVQQKAQTNAKSRRSTTHEVVFRELTLLSSRQSQRKRLPSLANTEGVNLKVGTIDVLNVNSVSINPFLVVVHYPEADSYKGGKCVVKVFAEPMMSLSEGLALTDKWNLGVRPELDQSVAVFMTSASSKVVRVVYPCRYQQVKRQSEVGENDPVSAMTWWWGLEIRDCLQECVIQRFTFDIPSPHLELPVLLRSVKVPLPPDTAESVEVLLLVDGQGRMAALDCAQRRLFPIECQSAQALALTFCPNADIITAKGRDNALIVLSSLPAGGSPASGTNCDTAQLAVWSLTFQQTPH